jgi:hypothetical protein
MKAHATSNASNWAIHTIESHVVKALVVFN